MELGGLHHVTAVTGHAAENLAFYTGVLGLRLVKKTVNQDDPGAYHLFYADENGSPGTEVTFFDWPQSGPNRPGAGAVAEIALRVAGGPASLERWARHFAARGVPHADRIEDAPDGSASLAFSDPEGQRLRLVAAPGLQPAASADIASDPAPPPIAKLDSVTLTTHAPEPTALVLTKILNLRQVGEDARGMRYEFAASRTGAESLAQEVRLRVQPDAPRSFVGIGGVHHVAFRVPDAGTQAEWRRHLVSAGLAVSEVVDRFYFRSIYFREPGGVLFEIATDGPGFAADEDAAHLGERLSLPPFLEPRRAAIEANLRPLHTVN